MSKDVYRYYNIPDVRDGLTDLERTILYVLWEARKEFGERHIPTVLIWGRVVEILDVNHEQFMNALQHVLANGLPQEPNAGTPPPELDLFNQE